MEKDKTGVQLNLGHTSTDDYITEKYVYHTHFLCNA